MKQVYLDLVDGFHIKVTPLRWDTYESMGVSYPTVLVRVEETAHGFTKGEEIQRAERRLFCIAGHSSVSGKINAVAPDLSNIGARI